MKKEIRKIEVDGETIYLKKSFFGMKIVKPIKIDGKINWENLIARGNWYNLLVIGFIVLVIVGSVVEYSNAINIASQCLLENKTIIIIP